MEVTPFAPPKKKAQWDLKKDAEHQTEQSRDTRSSKDEFSRHSEECGRHASVESRYVGSVNDGFRFFFLISGNFIGFVGEHVWDASSLAIRQRARCGACGSSHDDTLIRRSRVGMFYQEPRSPALSCTTLVLVLDN